MVTMLLRYANLNLELLSDNQQRATDHVDPSTYDLVRGACCHQLNCVYLDGEPLWQRRRLEPQEDHLADDHPLAWRV